MLISQADLVHLLNYTTVFITLTLMLHVIFAAKSWLLFTYQAQQVELQRTKKWVKMIRKWDKYYPGEKVKFVQVE